MDTALSPNLLHEHARNSESGIFFIIRFLNSFFYSCLCSTNSYHLVMMAPWGGIFNEIAFLLFK